MFCLWHQSVVTRNVLFILESNWNWIASTFSATKPKRQMSVLIIVKKENVIEIELSEFNCSKLKFIVCILWAMANESYIRFEQQGCDLWINIWIKIFFRLWRHDFYARKKTTSDHETHDVDMMEIFLYKYRNRFIKIIINLW